MRRALLLLALTACGSVPAEEAASSADPVAETDAEDLRAFDERPEGGGAFGRWIVDAHGLPAFAYGLDGARGNVFVTGNDRVNVLAADDGYVQLFGNERGPMWTNRFAEDQKNLGGGFSYVDDGGETYSTLYRYAPAGSSKERVFGVGYYETRNVYRGLSVRHRIHAPEGDDPFVIDEVELVNESDAPKDVSHYEYWDVNRHQLLTSWVRTGLAAGPSDRARDALNGKMLQRVTWDAATRTLRATMTPRPGEAPPPRDAISAVDWYPPPIFLELLSGDVDEVYADQRSFFGKTGELAPVSGQGQPAMFGMRTTTKLAPHQKKTLRFAYGYEPDGVAGATLARRFATEADPLGASLARWKDRLAYVKAEGTSPVLHREIAWRSHTLLAHTVRNDYYGEKYTAQGSAYLYLHGADGVPRDQALFALATTYLDPSIAKGNLRMVMAVTDAATGQKAYSFTGYGVNEGAGLHEHPSDLDIFFFVGLAEYLAATGDHGFLSERVELHPRGAVPAKTVLEHVALAFRHLRDVVGLGPHGLVRMSDGDWSDGIVFEDMSPTAVLFTKRSGESVPNSQMALYAVPLLADRIASLDPALAAEMKAYAAALEAPVRATFGSRWFGRAWLRNSIDQGYLKGTDRADDPYRASYIDLEAQPWGILSGVLSPAETSTLVGEVEARLDADSPIGPRLRPGGQVWPAISQLMTWAYARTRPAAAWRSIDEHLYATHAGVFPNQWIGILSGPDGFESAGTSGGTWSSPVTPMTDFPVANMNPEAMMLVGLLRTAGIEPLPDGLLIAPRGDAAHATYALDLPLLSLRVSPARISGVYRAKNAGSTVLTIEKPGGERVKVPLTFAAGDERPFAVNL